MSEEQTTPEMMKVTELRSALTERGLDTKGTKPILLARLQEALDAEKTPSECKQVEENTTTTTESTESEEKSGQKGDKENMDVEEDASTEEDSTSTIKPTKSKESGDKENMEVEEDKSAEEKIEETPTKDGKGTKRKLADEPFEVKENEPEIPESLLCLDVYNSDLNLRINEDFISGQPFSRDGWAYCYAGVRATYGLLKGKAWFEVKYVDNLEVKIDKETTTFDLRVGWSSKSSNLMLGEDSQSWCYSSCEGKMANNKIIEEYGEQIEKGDVIGAFIDFEGDEVSMTFTKNGEDQGDAFQIPKADLGGVALFPHVMVRNVKFEVNFGKDKDDKEMEDWKEKLDGGYIKAAMVAEENRERGVPRIAMREECEMIMMIGLPCSGKTTWVEKHVAENPDKHYNVISTSTMINKMTVNGEPLKKHHKGKWEQVVQKATRSLHELLRAASQRRRNVIIDQTNVYPNALKRKARPFEGFQRRCMVVVPTDEEYKARCKAQEDAGCKDIPDEAIMEMKANFTLPEEEVEETLVKTFVEIKFLEKERGEAAKVVELYNKIAKEKGYGKKHEERKAKKPRGNQNVSNVKAGARGNLHSNRVNSRGNFRGNTHGHMMRGGMGPMRGGMGPMRGGMGPMRGGMGPMMGGMGPMSGGTGPMSGGMGPMRGGQAPWARGMGGPGMMGGMMGRNNIGVPHWQGGNMGGPGPQGWGPWNQGGEMSNVGGNRGNMRGGMGTMRGGMGTMGNMEGRMGNMGGSMVMRGGMGNIEGRMGNMGGDMNNMSGGMGSRMGNMGGGMSGSIRGGMVGGMGGEMNGNMQGGNNGTWSRSGGSSGGQEGSMNKFGGNPGGFRQGYPGSQMWGGYQSGGRGRF